MTEIVLIDPAEKINVQFNWDGIIGTASLVSVVHTAPSPLVKDAEETDAPNKMSTVMLHGAVHGQTYLVEATATLSNGEIVNRHAVVRGLNA